MNDQKLYRVSVYGTFCKDILVYGKSEEDAVDYVQDICDNTNLITFGAGDLVDLSAEDAIDVEDDGCDHDCENCPEASLVPSFSGSIMPVKKRPEPAEKGAPLLHIPAQEPRKEVSFQPENEKEGDSRHERAFRLMGNLIAQYYDACESFDDLRDTVEELLDEFFQQSPHG